MYVTKQDYLNFTGIDLDMELYDGDQVSNKSERFIERVEDFSIKYLSQHFDFDSSMIEESPFLEKFKKGLMVQIEYTIANGWTNTMSDEALYYFRSCGFCNIRKVNAYD